MPFFEVCFRHLACCNNCSQTWLVIHMCVLAMFDMMAYSMCLVPIVTLLRKISLANGKWVDCTRINIVDSHMGFGVSLNTPFWTPGLQCRHRWHFIVDPSLSNHKCVSDVAICFSIGPSHWSSFRRARTIPAPFIHPGYARSLRLIAGRCVVFLSRTRSVIRCCTYLLTNGQIGTVLDSWSTTRHSPTDIYNGRRNHFVYFCGVFRPRLRGPQHDYIHLLRDDHWCLRAEKSHPHVRHYLGRSAWCMV